MLYIEILEKRNMDCHNIVCDGSKQSLVFLCNLLEKTDNVINYRIISMLKKLGPRDFGFSEEYFKKWCIDYPSEIFKKIEVSK